MIEDLLDRRGDEGVFVAEGAEQGAFGDAGRFGDLTGRHVASVLAQERHGREQDRFAPVLRSERPGSFPRERLDVHERVPGLHHPAMLNE